MFEALTLIAAGGFSPAQIRGGHGCVMQLQADMDEFRRANLAKLGFGAEEALELSRLHTRNFM